MNKLLFVIILVLANQSLMAEWDTAVSKDNMTGEHKAYAISPITYPVQEMSSPYTDVTAWIGIGCDSKKEWAYFIFNIAPNLVKDETEDGYNLIRTRIRWDDEVANMTLTQDWGDESLSVRYDEEFISNIESSNTALLELQWYGQRNVYFEFNLKGSLKAIAEIRKGCSGKQNPK